MIFSDIFNLLFDWVDQPIRLPMFLAGSVQLEREAQWLQTGYSRSFFTSDERMELLGKLTL